MITSRLKGGLGNQMFQIAAGYAHAKNTDQDFAIDFNITHHGGQGHPHLKYKDNLFKTIPTDSFKGRDFVMYNEPTFKYSEIIKDDKDMMIDGYFQSEKYFEKYRDDILNLFTFPDDIVEQVETKYQKFSYFFPFLKIFLTSSLMSYHNALLVFLDQTLSILIFRYF